MDTTLQNQSRPFTRLGWLQLGLFWSWNLIFLAFMSLGFAPIMLPELFTAVRTGVIPVAYLVYALVLAVIPVAAVILGLTALRHYPARLLALGYVVEGPLMIMLAVRFFIIRQVTSGTLLLMSVALLGMAAYLWSLLDARLGSRHPIFESIRLVGLALMALTSLYAAAWIAFYALPVGMEIERWLVNTLSHLPRELGNLGRSLGRMFTETPLMAPFSVLGFILLIYTATLFVLTPLAVPLLSLRLWWRSLSRLADRLGWLRPALLSGGALVACVLLFSLANRQPQAQVFALLEKPPATAAEARSLIERSDSIRSGLLNAYLAPFRYISAEGEVRHIRDIYSSTFRISEQKAYAVERLYEDLASPMLYQPVHSPQADKLVDNHALSEEPKEAARLYQSFFDTPIVVAERPTIVQAVRSTWSFDRAEAAWQAVDDREVHLVSQELNLQEHGDWAEVELHEVYQNQTAERQEVIYYFNLPESAVLTGVWLGNNPDKKMADSFRVAPRGAAQAVYREQTRKQMDPALLEQIGPRQYRLRIFPIQPLRMTYDEQRSRTLVEDAPPMHMWLEWRQMAGSNGWPMPQLALLRNVYWDGATKRLLNGQPLETGTDEWLPKVLPASLPIQPQVHRVDLPGEQTVLAIPAGLVELPKLPEGLRLAVVIDRSRSMQAHAAEVTSSLHELQNITGLEKPVDVYLTASPYRGEEPSIVSLDELDPQDILYFGGQNAAQLIAQFDTLHAANRSDQSYNAILVLTDGTGYELGASGEQVSVPSYPVWVIHMGGDIPLGYDDQTLQAIQASGGGVAASLDEALGRMAVAQDAKSGSGTETEPVVDLVDGYLWSVLPTGQAETIIPARSQVETHIASDPFAALAARRLILAEMQRQRGTIDQLDTLDALHALALDYGIVTPYSSMIVLVTANQQAMLDRLSQLGDRYQREVESVRETTPSTPLPLAGVPEPQEWLLLCMAAALLVYLGYKKRAQMQARI